MQMMRFSQLSEPRQILLRLCQRINYGSILNLTVVDAEVCIEDPPEFSVDVKLDTDGGPSRELDLAEFSPPLETRRLLGHIDFWRSGVIDGIVVHNGIPRCAVLRGNFQEVRL